MKTSLNFDRRSKSILLMALDLDLVVLVSGAEYSVLSLGRGRSSSASAACSACLYWSNGVEFGICRESDPLGNGYGS